MVFTRFPRRVTTDGAAPAVWSDPPPAVIVRVVMGTNVRWAPVVIVCGPQSSQPRNDSMRSKPERE